MCPKDAGGDPIGRRTPFLYRHRAVLSIFAFSVNSGTIVAILGPNDVDKTTVLKCLNRVLHPKAGSIVQEGEKLSDLSMVKLARRVESVPPPGRSRRVA
ncbi:MAG: ATP-binding cassette domain-containing protein [Methanoregulaceae archaeon]